MNEQPLLPNWPSELVHLALADLEKCEADRNYNVDMDCGHFPVKLNERYRVDLCGAVVAQTLGGNDEPDYDTTTKLYFIYHVSVGEYEEALRTLEEIPERSEVFKRIEGVPGPAVYKDFPEMFKDDLRDIADLFAENGW